MPETADVSDFVARDGDENSLTVTEEIELNGEPKEVEFVPATRGFMNELDAMDPEEVEDEGIPKVLAKYRSPDFRNGDGTVPDETADNIPMNRLNKLFNAFLIGSGVDQEAIENPEEYVEGNPNL